MSSTAPRLNPSFLAYPPASRWPKRAIVEKLRETYAVERFAKSGALYDIKVSLLRDRATVTLDTTGEGLFKRGYKQHAVAAPIKETIAAAMVQLSFWKQGRILVDPCCGSGTIAIEAALLGRNIAPGLSRNLRGSGMGGHRGRTVEGRKDESLCGRRLAAAA